MKCTSYSVIGTPYTLRRKLIIQYTPGVNSGEVGREGGREMGRGIGGVGGRGMVGRECWHWGRGMVGGVGVGEGGRGKQWQGDSFQS